MRPRSQPGTSVLWVTRSDIGNLPGFKGAYVLALRLDREVRIAIARLSPGSLMPGWYLYIGSARGSGGIRGRVKRHLESGKKLHWHVDRLTVESAEMAALTVAQGEECDLVGRMLNSSRFEVPLAGFGSTDCRRCESHLLSAFPA